MYPGLENVTLKYDNKDIINTRLNMKYIMVVYLS